MGFSKTGKGKSAKGGKNSGRKAVDTWKHFGKSLLRPYADAFGTAINVYGKREKDVLKPKNIAKTRQADNSELLHRLEYGLSMSAASIHSAATFLTKYTGANWARTGIEEMTAMFEGPEGQQLMEALHYLDSSSEMTRSSTATKDHVKHLLSFLDTDADTKIKALKNVTMFTSRIYLGCTSLLELFALAEKPKIWATKYEPKEEVTSAMKAWLKSPRDTDKQIAAFASMIDQREKTKVKKSQLSDSDGNDSSSSGSSDGKKKKSKKAKDKKADKKKASSSDSSADSSDSDKKPDKKAKKVSKPKKEKKANSSDSDASDSDKKKQKDKDKTKKDKKKSKRSASIASEGSEQKRLRKEKKAEKVEAEEIKDDA